MIRTYIILNVMFHVAAIACFTADLNWEYIYNPFVIYKTIKVNWFGAWFLATVSFICTPFIAIIFYVYKLCTVGRR